MEIGRVSRNRRGGDNRSLSRQYTSESKLQFYQLPPTGNISLQEFEDLALERLKVLKAVETVGLRGLKDSEDYTQALQKELRSIDGPVARSICRTDCDPGDIEKDHVSHFILRLAYCRTEELQRWFIAQEVDLFRYRFQNENTEKIKKFMTANDLNYSPISNEEKETNRTNLSFAISGHRFENTMFYKVPFTEAYDLVQKRLVYMHHGFVYVAHNDIVVLVLNKFRSHLSGALKIASRAFPNLEEDDRLVPMLLNLSKRYLGQDYCKTNNGQVTSEMVDALARTSFPLCMQELHRSLRHDHHLRYGGRLQYSLFLKGIGLSLQEAMKFWRTEFTRLMDVDKFEKQYAYNFRHSYGKEGKRADYAPYSCVKIITTNAPATGEYHGCPFRHADASIVRQKLQALQIAESNTEEILTMMKAGHFQLACGKCFEATHKTDTPFSPNHPNEYYELSQEILNGGPNGNQSKFLQHSQKSQEKTPKTPKVNNAKENFDDQFDNDFPMSVEAIEQSMLTSS